MGSDIAIRIEQQGRLCVQHYLYRKLLGYYYPSFYRYLYVADAGTKGNIFKCSIVSLGNCETVIGGLESPSGIAIGEAVTVSETGTVGCRFSCFHEFYRRDCDDDVLLGRYFLL